MSKPNSLLIGVLPFFTVTSQIPSFPFVEHLITVFEIHLTTACQESPAVCLHLSLNWEGHRRAVLDLQGIHIFCTKTDQLTPSFSP